MYTHKHNATIKVGSNDINDNDNDGNSSSM